MCYFAFLCGIFSLELFSAHLVLRMWILAGWRGFVKIRNITCWLIRLFFRWWGVSLLCSRCFSSLTPSSSTLNLTAVCSWSSSLSVSSVSLSLLTHPLPPLPPAPGSLGLLFCLLATEAGRCLSARLPCLASSALCLPAVTSRASSIIDKETTTS